MQSISSAARRYLDIIEREENESRFSSSETPILNHPAIHPEPFVENLYPAQQQRKSIENSHLIPQEITRFEATPRINHAAYLPLKPSLLAVPDIHSRIATTSFLNRYQEHPAPNDFQQNLYTGRFEGPARAFEYSVDPATIQYATTSTYQVFPTSHRNPSTSNLYPYQDNRMQHAVLPIRHTQSNFQLPMAPPVNRNPLHPSNKFRAGPSTDFYRPFAVHRSQSQLSIPDYYSTRPSINDQTFTVKSGVQGDFLEKDSTISENDIDNFFGSKENNSVLDESRLTSDYFSGSKNIFNFESMTFSPPPEKRPKIQSDESGNGSDVMMESAFKKPQDKSTKISTESLFGDATMDSNKIFSQSDVLDDGQFCISGIINISSSVEESFNKSVQAKTKKPVDVDVSLSFNVDSSVNSTYFHKVFDKQKKGVQKQKKLQVGAKKNIASVRPSSRRLRSDDRKRNSQVSASEPILKRTSKVSVAASKISKTALEITESSEQVIPVTVSKSKVGISSQPIATSKFVEATNPTLSSEPIAATSNKERDLNIINEILITKDFSKINHDTVNTYYNTKERQCFYENKKKLKLLEEGPANIDGDEPDFEEVIKVSYLINCLTFLNRFF